MKFKVLGSEQVWYEEREIEAATEEEAIEIYQNMFGTSECPEIRDAAGFATEVEEVKN